MKQIWQWLFAIFLILSIYLLGVWRGQDEEKEWWVLRVNSWYRAYRFVDELQNKGYINYGGEFNPSRWRTK